MQFISLTEYKKYAGQLQYCASQRK